MLRTQNKLKCLCLNTISYYDAVEKSYTGRGTQCLAGQYVNTVK